jgi:peptide chain release factor subunit 1
LVLAGSADFKTELGESDLFDQRLFVVIVNVVDLAYGGENGFTEAIEKSKEVLGNLKFVHEKKIINEFMTEISTETGKYVFGVEETIKAMEMGATKTLLVWENLNYSIYYLKHPVTD